MRHHANTLVYYFTSEIGTTSLQGTKLLPPKCPLFGGSTVYVFAVKYSILKRSSTLVEGHSYNRVYRRSGCGLRQVFETVVHERVSGETGGMFRGWKIGHRKDLHNRDNYVPILH